MTPRASSALALIFGCFLLFLLPGAVLAEDGKAVIKVEYVGGIRCQEITVYIDGKKFGTVKKGETKEFSIEATSGETVEMYINSPQLVIRRSEVTKFKVKPGAVIKALCDYKFDYGFTTTHKYTIDITEEKQGKVEPKPVVIPKEPVNQDVTVSFVQETVDKPVFTEPIEIVEGVVAEYTLEHTYERSITTSTGATVETGVKATGTVGSKLLFGSAELSAEVRAKVESSLGITVGMKDTFKQKITVDGNKTPKLKVIWSHRYRQGTAVTSDGKKETFLVCIGVRWKLVKD
jgi:hypothetical protein